MSDNVILKAEKRSGTGRRANYALRGEGKIPAIVYGKDAENENISVVLKDLIREVEHGNKMFNLDVEGKEKNVILKEIQYGTYLHEVVHADFIAVTENTVVTVSVPVELKGEAKGSKEGGVVDLDMHEISVSCKVKDMVDNIEVDVTDLELNGVIHVSDIPAIPGIKILSPADNAVATCHMHTVEAEPAEGEEGEEATEPEVIGEKKEEEEE